MIFFLLPIPFLVIIDLLSKIYFQNFERVNIISDFLFLETYKNPGIAFWIGVTWYLLKALTIILIIGLFCFFCKEIKNWKTTRLEQISFSLLIGGALWNAYERIFIGEVTDFIWVKYFAIFNFADIFISVWVWLYFLNYLLWNVFDQKNSH